MNREGIKKIEKLKRKSTAYAIYGFKRETRQIAILKDFDGQFCKSSEMTKFTYATVETLEYAIKQAPTNSDCLVIYLFMKDYPNKGFEITPFVIGCCNGEFDKLLGSI